jgi:hypothetical protein
LLHRRAFSSVALATAVALAAAVGGCSSGGELLDNLKETKFNVPTFEKPDWALLHKSKTAQLMPHGPVAPEELVDAAGRCGAPAQAAQPTQAAEAAAPEPVQPAPRLDPAAARAQARVGSVAGDLASAPMPQGPPPAPRPPKPKRVASLGPTDLGGLQPEGAGAAGAPVMGGIALGMTECQAVRRAGRPSHVTIGTGKGGVRKVVLTYQSGPRPGVYTFAAGRLKVIDAPPTQAKSPRKRPRRPARTASRAYVR